MQYITLKSETARKIIDAFYGHDNCINEKYSNMVGRKYEFDRNRFVQRFFSRYVGRYIAAIDTICYGITNRVHTLDKFSESSGCIPHIYILPREMSVYDNDFAFDWDGVPLTTHKKVYLKITHFEAFNSFKRSDGILMHAEDVCGHMKRYVVTYEMLRSFQWRLISKEEFDTVGNFFKDDREPVEFEVTRRVGFDEMVQRHLCRKNCSCEKIPNITETFKVAAVDRNTALDEAQKKYELIQNIEPVCEKSFIDRLDILSETTNERSF